MASSIRALDSLLICDMKMGSQSKVAHSPAHKVRADLHFRQPSVAGQHRRTPRSSSRPWIKSVSAGSLFCSLWGPNRASSWPPEPKPGISMLLRPPLAQEHRVHPPLVVCTTGPLAGHFFHGLLDHFPVEPLRAASSARAYTTRRHLIRRNRHHSRPHSTRTTSRYRRGPCNTSRCSISRMSTQGGLLRSPSWVPRARHSQLTAPRRQKSEAVVRETWSLPSLE